MFDGLKGLNDVIILFILRTLVNFLVVPWMYGRNDFPMGEGEFVGGKILLALLITL